MRTVSFAALVCVASWLGLTAGAGNVGLQRSVAVSPLTLLEVPAALALSAVLAFVTSWVLGSLDRGNAAAPIRLVGGVLVGDVIGAVVLAPILVGELELIHAPVVFAAITALGLQPVAAFAGAWLSRPRDARA